MGQTLYVNMLYIWQNDYALRQLYMFVNMCEMNIPQDVMVESIARVCQEEN